MDSSAVVIAAVTAAVNASDDAPESGVLRAERNRPSQGHTARTAGWLSALSLMLALTGCAGMYDTMGLVAKDSMAARDLRLAALEARASGLTDQLAELSVDVAKNKIAAEKFVEVENLMRQLEGRVDLLPQETLKRLASILSQAVAESGAPKEPR